MYLLKATEFVLELHFQGVATPMPERHLSGASAAWAPEPEANPGVRRPLHPAKIQWNGIQTGSSGRE